MEEQTRIKTTEIHTENHREEIQQDQNGMLEKPQPIPAGMDALPNQEEEPGDFPAQFMEAATALQNDTSRSSDSFEMHAVKQEVSKLREILQDGDPLKLLVQYSWMERVLRDKYLRPRQSERSSYRARHQKVRAILDLISAEKKKLRKKEALSEADVLKTEHRNMVMLSDRICRSDKGAANNRAALQKLLEKDVPVKPQRFAEEKEKILAAYDRLISSYQSIADSFCITERAKQNRLDAERVVLQLRQEKKLYQNATFESLAKSHYRTWGEDLVFSVERPVMQLNREELTQRKDLFVETDQAGIKADAATQMFYQLVGASTLCRSTAKASLDDGGEGPKEGLIIQKGQHFFTHEEAVAYSREHGKNLSYSYEALCQLATIQVIDMICGQKNRRPESFVYKLKERKVDDETYLMIVNVKVTDNTLSFGTETFEELNRDSEEEEEICTKKLVNDNGTLTISSYDEQVADTIISLDPALMHTYFLNMGLELNKADALSERLEKVQEALRNDKERGKRYKSTQATDQKSKEEGQQNFLYTSQHFIGSKALFRDRGTAAEGEMKDINDPQVNERVHSNALAIQKVEQIKREIEADMRDKFGYQDLPKETRRILVLIDKYTKANKSKEWYQTRWDLKLTEFLGLCNPKLLDHVTKEVERDQVPEDQKEAEIERRLVAKYENRDEMANRAEEGPLEELRPKLETRINALTSREGALSDQEQTELQKLRSYQTQLFGQCDGTLEIPANAGVRYVSDRTGFTTDIHWRKKDRTPLFCHEPRISDLNQGEVGDCYFVATLAAVVNREPDLIKQNMKDNGDGTVTVRFFREALFGDPKPFYVKVDKSIAGGEQSYKNGLTGAMWPKLYEKAFIASGLRKNRWFTRYSPKDIESGMTEDAALYITGREAKTLYDNNGTTSFEKYRDPNSKLARRFKEHVQRMKTLLQEATDNHQILMGGTFQYFRTEGEKTSSQESGFRGLTRRHAYTILGLVQIDGKDFVQLRNPGGRIADLMVNQITGNVTYRTELIRAGAFYLDLDTFCRFFRQVNAVNSPVA